MAGLKKEKARCELVLVAGLVAPTMWCVTDVTRENGCSRWLVPVAKRLRTQVRESVSVECRVGSIQRALEEFHRAQVEQPLEVIEPSTGAEALACYGEFVDRPVADACSVEQHSSMYLIHDRHDHQQPLFVAVDEEEASDVLTLSRRSRLPLVEPVEQAI